MSADLDRLLEFVRFTHQIRNVRRAVLLETESRNENDAEHMYQMALTAWYLIDKHNLKLDKYQCIGMALVHDIVEAYAGDTTAFASAEERAVHEQREKEAIAKLKTTWPEFESLHKLIEEYEEHKTPEGKFMYALDKFMPIVNNYLYGGKVWKKEGRTFDHMKKIKEGKIELSPEINEYYLKLQEILTEKESELFAPAENEKDL